MWALVWEIVGRTSRPAAYSYRRVRDSRSDEVEVELALAQTS